MKAIEILPSLKPTEEHYKKKVMILAKLMNEPGHGHELKPELYLWAKEKGLKITNNATDGCIWDTVSEK